MISIGSAAPDFTARAHDGTEHTLSALRGRKVWLGFYRYASCPLCNLRIRHTRARAPGWQARGLAMLAVFQAPPEHVTAYVGREAPPYPLLCDPDEQLYALYGVGASLAGYVSPKNMPVFAETVREGIWPGRMYGTKTRMPADYLIDEEGVVREAFGATYMAEHIPFERVERFVEG